MKWLSRFRKPPASPEHVVTTTMKPGKTTLRMVDDTGTVRAVVMLRQVTTDRQTGTTAEFVDLSHWMERTTLTRLHESWWTKAPHTGECGSSQ